ncbi:unnamed protein product [Clonostachys solani]|uniref:Heterokaryon incompatibility domain-containing protein n=1 Tax=Clonostachys solani TaxID=160281 RepID=A0A9N9W8F3_9HYPO|nr:unnamed protein product [Clonostachys solani]
MILVALVALLHMFDGKPAPNWRFGLTLNTIVAFLSTICRATMMVPVTVALSQLKWNWMSLDLRPLRDLYLFDQASRCSFWSVRLLLRLRGRYNANCTAFKKLYLADAKNRRFIPLASAASVALVVSLVISSVTQSAIGYRLGNVLIKPGGGNYSIGAFAPISTEYPGSINRNESQEDFQLSRCYSMLNEPVALEGSNTYERVNMVVIVVAQTTRLGVDVVKSSNIAELFALQGSGDKYMDDSLSGGISTTLADESLQCPERPMPLFNTRQPASLCERCKVVAFDDAEFEGFKRVKTKDSDYLGYDLPEKQQEGDEEFEFRLDFDLEDTFPHLPQLTQGAADGCGFCGYLKHLLLSDDVQCRLGDLIVERGDRELTVSIFLFYRWGTWLFFDSQGLDSLVVGLYMNARDFQTIDNNGDLEMEIILSIGSDETLDSADDACADWLRLWPSTQTDHLTERKLNWITSHVRDCAEGRHSYKCLHGERENASSFPTRLVDIAGPIPRLVYGDQIIAEAERNGREIPKYAALSYCWGLESHARAQLKTTAASEETMRLGIPIESLTGTIRDAVRVARAFQIPLLWVDSLCIIQDDIADWEREASRMGIVYSHAFVTFCSLGSSCHTSFLQPPSPTILIPFQSSLNDEIKGAYVLRYSTCAIGKVNANHLLTDVSSSRWLQRGWAHQEYVMSARLVVFGPHFVHFLCPSITAAENEEPASVQWQFLLRGVATDPEELYNEWGKSIAPIYSDRQFTKPEDALPAISGLARYFSIVLADEYIAGLWKRDMIRGLIWSYCRYPGTGFYGINDLLERLNQRAPYIAPSWSWIGRRNIDMDLYRQIQDTRGDFQSLCDIEATVDVQGQNPFGRISHAQLRVTAPTYTFSDTAVSQNAPDRGSVEISLPEGTVVFCTIDWTCSRLEGQFKLIVIGSVDWEKTSKSRAQRKAVGSTLGNLSDGESLEKETTDIYGLLLHVAPHDDRFYRVGVFNSYSQAGGGIQLLNSCDRETIYII